MSVSGIAGLSGFKAGVVVRGQQISVSWRAVRARRPKSAPVSGGDLCVSVADRRRPPIETRFETGKHGVSDELFDRVKKLPGQTDIGNIKTFTNLKAFPMSCM